MSIRLWSNVLAFAAVSFAAGLSVIFAADCSRVGVPCPGWDAKSQQATDTGYCCVAQTNAAVPCTTGRIKSVTTGTGSCGQLRLVESGNCGCTNAGYCGLGAGNVGCTSVNCGS
jgi:hypothetical protein